MKLLRTLPFVLLIATTLFTSCKNEDKKKETETKDTEMKEPKLKEQMVPYVLDSTRRSNFIVYDENIEGKRPVVFVIHEWWGLNDYAKMRARELAKLGYIAMAIDMYGDGKMGTDPKIAGELSGPFYANPGSIKPIYAAALSSIKEFSQADTAKIGAIGYCFGGAMVLNLAKLGEDLKGVVSFHGNLNVVRANKDLLKAKILVCHGAADEFVPMTEVDQFKKQMDSIGASYTVKIYDGATHAFTNPEATAAGEKFKLPIKYNAAADSASWKEMKDFLRQVFQ
ncbi:MAG TPA: dienelactone hydrolase family protein [Chitinophagaceae bacterium]|jgi:dienelactone hydrolase|nr:dienelactone hydrolase family protein [Chitinophagaceae bacterium]